MKANYLVEHLGYDVFMTTTDHKEEQGVFYPLNSSVYHEDFGIGYNDADGFVAKLLSWNRKNREYKHKLTEFIRKHRIDICISVGWKEVDFLAELKPLCKVICEWHFAQNSSLIYAQTRYRSRIFAHLVGNIQVRRLMKHTSQLDRLVVLTKEDECIWNRTHNNVCQIYNPSSYKTSVLSDLSSKRFISVGRLEYQKGFEYAIEAWKTVHAKHPEWSLDIYGNGSLRDELQTKIDQSGLSGVVNLKGSTNELHKEYQKSSGFLMSSRYEGFPMVLLEASSFGLPLVSFDCVSGPKEIIKNAHNGFLVDMYDVKGLAQSVSVIIENEEERRFMGRCSAEMIECFSIDSIMEKWDALFKEIIHKGS